MYMYYSFNATTGVTILILNQKSIEISCWFQPLKSKAGSAILPVFVYLSTSAYLRASEGKNPNTLKTCRSTTTQLILPVACSCTLRSPWPLPESEDDGETTEQENPPAALKSPVWRHFCLPRELCKQRMFRWQKNWQFVGWRRFRDCSNQWTTPAPPPHPTAKEISIQRTFWQFQPRSCYLHCVYIDFVR